MVQAFNPSTVIILDSTLSQRALARIVRNLVPVMPQPNATTDKLKHDLGRLLHTITNALPDNSLNRKTELVAMFANVCQNPKSVPTHYLTKGCEVMISLLRRNNQMKIAQNIANNLEDAHNTLLPTAAEELLLAIDWDAIFPDDCAARLDNHQNPAMWKALLDAAPDTLGRADKPRHTLVNYIANKATDEATLRHVLNSNYCSEAALNNIIRKGSAALQLQVIQRVNAIDDQRLLPEPHKVLSTAQQYAKNMDVLWATLMSNKATSDTRAEFVTEYVYHQHSVENLQFMENQTAALNALADQQNAQRATINLWRHKAVYTLHQVTTLLAQLQRVNPSESSSDSDPDAAGPSHYPLQLNR